MLGIFQMSSREAPRVFTVGELRSARENRLFTKKRGPAVTAGPHEINYSAEFTGWAAAAGWASARPAAAQASGSDAGSAGPACSDSADDHSFKSPSYQSNGRKTPDWCKWLRELWLFTGSCVSD